MRDLADELLQAKVKARLFGGDHAPRIGRLVLLDRIGTGAMGAVYAAYDARLDRRVAVKVLHAADPDANARMLREARALGKLAHPNVVTIHDAAEDAGAVYVVMELATGVPLRAWIATPRAWQDVVRVLREAAAGLAAAHRAGLVHRDVKPENILVGDDRTRVVDFGLAETPLDEGDDGAGTPSYMAPEVLAGANATPASDQFSFGVTLYEALYGERPHVGTTRAELRQAAERAASARPGSPATPSGRPAAAADEDASRPGHGSDETTNRPPLGPPAGADPRRDIAEASTHRAPAPARADVDADLDAAQAPTVLSTGGPPGRPSPGAIASRPPSTAPGWLHAIVRRALAADPAQRFASMDAVVAALAHDRRKHRVLGGVAAGALVLGAIGGVIAYRAHAGPGAVDRCDGSARRAAVWNAGRAAAVRASLGDAAWTPTAVARLDAVATGWAASYRRVCEATRVAGGQSDRLLELRMRCLDRALERFDALTGALASPLDAEPRAEAAAAIGQLAPPHACETIVDAAELALPTDPAARTRARDAEHALDQAWATYALGRYRDARVQVAALDRATADLDASGVRAAIVTLAATVEARVGEPAGARAVLERALAATATARAADLEHVVWTRLLRHELFAGDPARTIEWAPFAHAAAARAGLEGAEIDGIVGEALRDGGQLARAREHLQRALASRDPLRGDQRAILELNLGSIELAAGRSDLATAAFRRGHDLARDALGDGHPTVALYLDKLAEADRARGRIADALAKHATSVALREAAFGPDDRAVATALLHRGETLLEAGALARATADLEAARAVRATRFGATSARLAELEAMLGDVALAAGRRADALAAYDRAAVLDPRLDLVGRRHAAGAAPIPSPALQLAVEPFSLAHVRRLAVALAAAPRDRATPIAAALHARWRSAGALDASLSLAVGDALRAAGDEAAAIAAYRAALAALTTEPSRTRLAVLRALAPTDPAAARAAEALQAAMPELAR